MAKDHTWGGLQQQTGDRKVEVKVFAGPCSGVTRGEDLPGPFQLAVVAVRPWCALYCKRVPPLCLCCHMAFFPTSVRLSPNLSFHSRELGLTLIQLDLFFP